VSGALSSALETVVDGRGAVSGAMETVRGASTEIYSIKEAV